ncbi:MAG: DUF1801 domain-containing protein [Spirochaetales bacterium]|nr:DUF1801 domain-containing protein [Spirochaetales bacterium]
MNKCVPTKASVHEFLLSLESPKKRSESVILLDIYQSLTKYDPVMWGTSIIGFGLLEYTYISGRTGIMPMAGFSPRKKALTLYIDGNFDDFGDLLCELGKHRRSKACLYINTLDDVHLPVLRQIIWKDFLFCQNP